MCQELDELQNVAEDHTERKSQIVDVRDFQQAISQQVSVLPYVREHNCLVLTCAIASVMCVHV